MRERERKRERERERGKVMEQDTFYIILFCENYIFAKNCTMYHFVPHACSFPDALSCCPRTTSIVSGKMLKAIQQQ